MHQGPDLPPGHHLLPFTLTLPVSLPSSFTGDSGKVKYHLQATVVRDWKFDHEVTEPVTIRGILDLNLMPAARQEGRGRSSTYRVTDRQGLFYVEGVI